MGSREEPSGLCVCVGGRGSPLQASAGQEEGWHLLSRRLRPLPCPGLSLPPSRLEHLLATTFPPGPEQRVLRTLLNSPSCGKGSASFLRTGVAPIWREREGGRAPNPVTGQTQRRYCCCWKEPRRQVPNWLVSSWVSDGLPLTHVSHIPQRAGGLAAWRPRAPRNPLPRFGQGAGRPEEPGRQASPPTRVPGSPGPPGPSLHPGTSRLCFTALPLL